jgi:hypothetical protein
VSQRQAGVAAREELDDDFAGADERVHVRNGGTLMIAEIA